MRYLYITFIFCFFYLNSFGQKYNFQRYSIEEGLPRSSVYDIYEDIDGLLWIGTDEGGLSVFDGKRFHTYTTEDGLVSNKIRCIYQDRKKRIWLGSDEGVSCFEKRKFTNYTTKQGLPNFDIRTIQEDKEGNLFFGTLGAGLYKLKNHITDSSKCFDIINTQKGLINDRIRVLLLDSRGSLWIGTDEGISKMNGKLIQNFTIKDGLPNNSILSIFEDKNHILWFGTREGVAELKGNVFKMYTTQNGLVHDRIRAISQDYTGNMWFGTSEGASCFDGTKFKSVTDSNGLSNNRIRVIKQDRNKNLWFGTQFGGINKYLGGTFINYTMSDGLHSNEVYSISGFKNELAIGTFAEVCQFNLSQNSLHLKENDELHKIHERIQSIHYDINGFLWVGSREALHIFKGKKEVSHFVFKDHRIAINSFYEDKNNMYINTSKGVFVTRFDSITSTLDSVQCLHEVADANTILSLENKHYFIGTDQNGLLEIDSEGKIKKRWFPTIKKINSIVKDHLNRIWIASENGGVICLNPNNTFKIYTNKDGLSSKHAHLLIFDNHDDLWIGYENGVDKIEFDPNGQINHIYHFGKDEGFVGIETNKNSVYKDDWGRIWFGTIKGAICFNHHAEHLNKTAPITHILSIKVSGGGTYNEYHKFKYHNDHFEEIPKNLTLSHNINNISFSIQGINLTVPDKVKYQWKLEGYDEDWSKPSSQSIINYTNLPYGKYTFLVKSCNENTIWNEVPTSFQFEITTPFWRKNWFYVIVTIAAFFMLYLLFHWRIKRLQHIKIELENQVNLRTEELKKEKELVESQNSEIENKRKELENKNTSITDSINYAKRIQQAVMSPKQHHKFSLNEDMFILHKPRDIVSGDFYWLSEKNNKAYIVAADCTGHGVPGAFMSMLGITLLNQLINEENSQNAGKILNTLRKKIVSTLSNGDKENQSPDGMDLALLIFDLEKNEVQFSGANNPLIYIHNHELNKIKPNKMPIGVSDYMDMSFTTHTLPFHKGDVFYIFSDGYADQFGGDEGKKFLSKSFHELLFSIHELTLEEQKSILDKTIEAWKGNHFQVDDILVIGIKIK